MAGRFRSVQQILTFDPIIISTLETAQWYKHGVKFQDGAEYQRGLATLPGSSLIREEYKNRGTVNAFFVNTILDQGRIFSGLQSYNQPTLQTL